MNRWSAVGLAAFALGATAIAVPALVPISVARWSVDLVAIGAVAMTYRAVRGRRGRRHGLTTTPDPEVLAPAEPPAGSVSEALTAFLGNRRVGRSGLHEATVTVLTRYAGLDEAAAREAVERGTWTDDPFAAAYLGGAVPDVSVVRRLVEARGRSGYVLGRRRTVEALARVVGLEPTSSGGLAPLGRWFDRSRPPPAEPAEEAPRPTGHWLGVSAVALAAIGVGGLAGVAPVVLAGVVGVGFAAYARASSPPEATLAAERRLETDRPALGDEVEVTVTLRNEGERFLPDLRVVDGVPGTLAVAAGSPRLGTALRPGETATLTYAVTARRGVHAFGPVEVLVRDLAGSSEASVSLPAEATLTCVPPLEPTVTPVPLRPVASREAGPVSTGHGGDGVEFFATRPYQPGDPTNRIDWNRRARTGELATLEFREERTATVVVVVDVRPGCFRAPRPHVPHAVDRAVDAAGRLAATRLAAGDRVGLATFGASTWVAPGTGRVHRAHLERALATELPLARDGPPSRSTRWRRELAHRLPTGAQLVVCTPLTDRWAPGYVRTFDATGHPATVVSPDPTTADAEAALLEATARRVRITDLRRVGIPVADWAWDEPLDLAVSRLAGRRWVP